MTSAHYIKWNYHCVLDGPGLISLSFFIILIGCEFFTNGVEWAGKRLNLAKNAVGSVLAAIGTALPETILPIVAILFLTGGAGQTSVPAPFWAHHV